MASSATPRFSEPGTTRFVSTPPAGPVLNAGLAALGTAAPPRITLETVAAVTVTPLPSEKVASRSSVTVTPTRGNSPRLATTKLYWKV